MVAANKMADGAFANADIEGTVVASKPEIMLW